MSLKETIENILAQLHDFQWSINDLDYTHNLRYYNIVCLDLSSNPMVITLLAKDTSRDPEVLSWSIDLLDILFTNKVTARFDSEMEHLKKTGAPKEQIGELQRIRELFGL
jgi:hypothetical protein